MEPVASCGERLKLALVKKGIRQAELCKRTGIPKSAVSQYIRGYFEPRKERLQQIADVLEVPALWLMGYDIPTTTTHSTRGENWVRTHGLEQGNPQPVPVLGRIPAGSPLVAEENWDSYEMTQLSHPGEHFFLRVQGDSMIGAGILDGSLALIRKQNHAENGQIVACLLDGENATLKRYQRQEDLVMLMPENPKYEPILLRIEDFESQDAVILGILVEIKIKFL